MNRLPPVERLVDLGMLVRRRREKLGLDVAPTARAVGVAPDTWTKIESGGMVGRTSVYGRVERALGWRGGSMSEYLDGGPEPGEQVEATIDIGGGELLTIKGAREVVEAYAAADEAGRAALLTLLTALRKPED